MAERRNEGLPATSTRYGIRWPEPDGATLHVNLATRVVERHGPPARTRRVLTCFTVPANTDPDPIAPPNQIDCIEVYVSRSGRIRVWAKGRHGSAEMTPGEWR